MHNHVIDPSGDVVFTLRNPNAAFAVWDDAPPPPGPQVSPQTEPQAATSAADPVTFLLSSRHLILASPVFKAMLTGGWKEGERSEGQHQMDTEDWDAEALAIVMNVLHSRYRQVPATVTLETLGKIAVIVDYYQIHEALLIMAPLWIKALLERQPPKVLGRDLILWIVVSWVFRDGAVFRVATKVAILRTRKDLEIPRDLPIPSAVIDRINQYRNDSTASIAAGLDKHRQGYLEGREGCSFECAAIHLGALLKNLHGLGFLGPRPEAPFGDANLAEVVEGMSKMKSPRWCTVQTRGFPNKIPCQAHRCPPIKGRETAAGASKLGVAEKCFAADELFAMGTLDQLGAALFHRVKDKMEGLQLDDFISDA